MDRLGWLEVSESLTMKDKTGPGYESLWICLYEKLCLLLKVCMAPLFLSLFCSFVVLDEGHGAADNTTTGKWYFVT
jgi:hypothetical protein